MISIRIGNKMKGSAVVILDKEDNVLLLLRSRKSHWMPSKWGLPGGRIEPGEEPEDAAVRETKEETTLDIKGDDLTRLENFSNKHVDIFHTRVYNGTVEIDFEHEDHRWVSRDEIKNYDTTPPIVNIFDWILKNE
jgi:8-oxo-dGTP diphosphatase